MKALAPAGVVAVAALAWSGCGTSPSSCRPPVAPPTVLSGTDRRDPEIAGDGAGAAVVAWERLSGGPIEASSLDGGAGAWTPAVDISAPAAHDVSLAMSPDGVATAAWQRQPVGGVDEIEVARREPGGAWSAPTVVSTPGKPSRQPVAGADGHGGAIVAWRRDTHGDHAAIEVAELSATGRWSAPRAISAGDVRARRPRLAEAADGAAAVVWEERRAGTGAVVAATRLPDGTWSAPTIVSGPITASHEPDVAIGPTGDVTAVWIGSDGDGVGVYASESAGSETWTGPVRIARGSGRPREVPRPGRADTGADVAALPDGGAVAAWTLFDGGADVVATAVRAGGAWGPPQRLSRGATAGGVKVASRAGGGAVVAWEERDGGLIRARAEDVDPEGACLDMSRAVAETGSVRIAGGAVPLVAFVDLSRDRVEAGPVP